jgi:hypothetical protein
MFIIETTTVTVKCSTAITVLFLYFMLCLKVQLDTVVSLVHLHPYTFFTKTQIKVKEQLVVRKDMDVNEHDRLSNITLRHKLK